MAPAKRKNATAAAVSKKAKSVEWADITKEIRRADLSKEVQGMLLEVLPLSLGEFSDQRHKYQEQMVSALEGVLKDIEAKRVEVVSKYQADLEMANKQKSENDNSTAEAQREKEIKSMKVQEHKVSLAVAAGAFRSARDEKNNAEDLKRSHERTVLTAEKNKAHYLIMKDDLEFLRSAMPDAIESSGKGANMLSMMKKWNFEESLQIALPSVFAKAPDARGQFDVIALEGLAVGIQKRIAEQEEVIARVRPEQDQHEAAISDALEALKNATSAQLLAAKAFEDASVSLQTSDQQHSLAQKAAKDGQKKATQLTKALDIAEAELEIFRDGPVANFDKLRQRTEPVAEEPVVGALESVPEEAPVINGEEQAQVVGDGVALD